MCVKLKIYSLEEKLEKIAAKKIVATVRESVRVRVRVCVVVWLRVCVCVSPYVCARACVRGYEGVKKNEPDCVCACVSRREREREREREKTNMSAC